MTKKVKLGTAVCIFCKHCEPISKGDWEEDYFDFLCLNSPNQRVVNPVNGRPFFVEVREVPAEEEINLLEGDIDSDPEMNIKVQLTDSPHMNCCEVNRWGYCDKFSPVSKKEREKRLGKSSQSKEDFSELIVSSVGKYFPKDRGKCLTKG
jgi:hypothetical protein